jgi:DNA-binding response OmpR family regulator
MQLGFRLNSIGSSFAGDLVPEQLNVLVIDDDKDVLEFFQHQLSRDDSYAFNLCQDSKLGLETLSESTPDILIIDWMMPGQNGIDVLREIDQNPEIDEPGYITMISGAPDLELLSMIAMELGAAEVLPKPMTKKVATAMLKRAEIRIATGV